MKKLILTLFISSLSCFLIGQNAYWTVYDMYVENGHENEVIGAIDKFMKTDAGKSMPALSVSVMLFAPSDIKTTHRLAFISPDKAIMAKMYTGVLQQTTDFQLMESTLNSSWHNVGAYLGKSLYSTPLPTDNYETVIGLHVTDPGKYLAAFKKFSDGVHAKYDGKIGMSLHQFYSGQESGMTHVVVVATDTFENLLGFTDEIYQSDLFKALQAEVKDIRKVLTNTTSATLARYNQPTGQ